MMSREDGLPMTEAEKAAARRMEEIAERAEKKAREREREASGGGGMSSSSSSSSSYSAQGGSAGASGGGGEGGGVRFLSKAQREALALKKLEDKRKQDDAKSVETAVAYDRFVTGKAIEEREREVRLQKQKDDEERQRRQREENMEAKELDHELVAIREHYLGAVVEKKKVIYKPSDKFKKIFQFDWEADDDTTKGDFNPLYGKRTKLNPLFGRGYIGGIDPRDQRKKSNFLESLTDKRMQEIKDREAVDTSLTEAEKIKRAKEREQRVNDELRAKRRQLEEAGGGYLGAESSTSNLHWSEKKLDDMTERDWRIFREDFDIRIMTGKSSLPLRYWSEAKFPPEIMRAIDAMNYKTPSPIQRQAIPVGISGRDIIGIAETGSGKTAAFVIPMLCYMMKLPPLFIARVNTEGPLAVIMAPTRELAIQIEDQCKNLAKFTKFKTVCVVGGQDIDEQAARLHSGVEICVGTPGRMVDCIVNRYMVLNQCNYVVLDEADRMIDMGFEPQVMAVLDAMGGVLKAEDEAQADAQSANFESGKELYRITSMYSATMPAAVEKIAKTYLRHPVKVRIGDEESGKNKRIQQTVMWTTEGQKKNLLVDLLNKTSKSDKVIVFINEKKQCDYIATYLENLKFKCGVLHGGKSQDQREYTLEQFRSSSIQVLLASDVAARGLDINDVSQVINFDLPKKIENYCHRIGRTGRAGKTGTAFSLLTEGDTDIMYELREYLEKTSMPVPRELAKHESAQHAAGARDEGGKLLGEKRKVREVK